MVKKCLNSIKEEAMFVTDRQTDTQTDVESTTKNNRLLARRGDQ